jgi:cobalt-zinc-cadmium efflux system outer membrane protein
MPVYSALLAATLLVTPQQADPITIDQALALARQRRPQIAEAAARVREADGLGRLATTIPNPALQFETHGDAPTRKFTVVQPLGWLARIGSDHAISRALSDRGTADSARIAAEVARDVRRAFYAALAATELERLAAEQLSIADSLVRIAELRMEAGDISALERDQTGQEASRARLAASRAREEATISRADLARAIAAPAGASVRVTGPMDAGLDASFSLPAQRDAAAPEFVPGMRIALADSAAAKARLVSARTNQIPIPALLVGQEWGSDGPATVRRDLILGIALPVPLFSQGGEATAAARGAADAAAARAAEARLTYSALIDAAHTRVAESTERARFARDSLVTGSRRIRSGAVRLYEEGRSGILPVLDAMRAEREINREAFQELLAFQEARADLLGLLGRWD